MSVFSKTIIGQVEKLANSPVLGTGASACGFKSHLAHQQIIVVELVKENATKTMLQTMLHLTQRVAICAKGVTVDLNYLTNSSLRN
jgi:hypothetical protein